MRSQVDRVWRTLKYLGVRDADLPDAAQEVFLVVHRRLPEFRGDAKVETWIYEIACFTAKAWRRKAATRRDRPPSESLPVIPIDAAQEADLDDARSRARLERLLEELPEEQRAVVVLHEIEELPMREVADLLGCPMFTAYSRLRLAKKRLQKALEAAREEDR
jgi:RNA polymerase sigma-70 factor (ECF subfamily)